MTGFTTDKFMIGLFAAMLAVTVEPLISRFVFRTAA